MAGGAGTESETNEPSIRRGRRRAATAFVAVLIGPAAELLDHGTDIARWGRWTELALCAAAIYAAVLSLQRWHLDRRAAVGLMACGTTCWAIGQLLWTVDDQLLDSANGVDAVDAWFLLFPVLMIAGLVARSRGFALVGRLAVFSDAALLTTAVWFLLWETVISSGVDDLGVSRSEQVLVALYAFGGVAVTALAGVMMIRQWTPTLSMVLVAGLAFGTADTIAAATWDDERSWWYLAIVAGRGVALAALAALSGLPSRPSAPVETRPQLLRLVVVYVPGIVLLFYGLVEYALSGRIIDPVAGALVVAYVVMLALNQTIRWFESAAYANDLRTSVERLGTTEAQLRDLLGDIPEALLVLDRTGCILEANESLVELTGRSSDELIGSPFTVLLRDDDHVGTFTMFATMLEGEDQQSPILEIDRADGTSVYVEAAARIPVRDIDRIAVTLRDVTDRVSRTEALERAQERFRRAFHGAPIGMVLTTVEDGVLLDANAAIERMLGYPREHVVGRRAAEFIHPEDQTIHDRYMQMATRPVDSYATEQRLVRSDGEIVWTRTSVSLLHDAEHGHVAIGHIEDITEQRRSAMQLEWAANHDELTGLPNRTMFMAELLRRVAASPAGSIAVLFIDLDNFKVINDSLGHAIGDELLRAMTERLSASLRDGDMLCRFGGDEFVVMLSSSAGEGSPKATAERLRREIARPLTIDGVELFVTGSIGIAIADSQTATASDLLRDADAAMYRAKARGRDFVEVFAPGVHDASVLALRTSNELRRAIERDEIVPYYQPIIDLPTGVLTGFEVLARWRHPERGLLGADMFLPMAEETGLITEVGASVLRASLVQLGRWRDRSPEFADLSVSVNVSSRQLLSGEFVGTVADALAEAGVPAASLWLEITETALMTDVKAATIALRELRSLGLHLSVDDFGTGYSSLTYLKRFPVEAIKVDRSFVNGLGIDAEDSTIVEAVINLGHSLGIGVVAEGVETPLQLSRLRELGCDRAQGYLFGRPRPAEIIEAERTMS